MRKNQIKFIIYICFLLMGSCIYAQNVGIGTTTPTTKLHVKGQLRVDTLTSGTTGDSIVMINSSGLFKKMSVSALGIPSSIDVTVDVTGLASGLSSPNSFSGATFSPNTPANTNVIYINTADGSQWTYNGSQYVTYVANTASSNYYLSGGTTDASNNKTSTVYRAGAVGIGSTTTPHASAQLDVNSTTKGFLPPRMTQAQMNAIASPAAGLIVYCTNCSPVGLKVYDGSSWTDIGGNSTPTIAATCRGFVTGTYINGTATSGVYRVRLTNNSFSSATISFANSDLVLSGVSGLSVTATSPASLTLAAGATDSVSYTISGTPTSNGTLTGSWSKLTLSCSATKAVTGLSGLFAASYCDSTSFNGTMVSAVAFSGNTLTVKLTNTSGATTPTLPAPATSNLVLSYTGTGSLSVASVSPNTTFTVAAGATQTITYTLSGTPTSTGTLTGTWTYSDMTCTKSRPIGLGDAVFSKNVNQYVFSVNDASIPLNSQGTLAIGSTALMPYTSGAGSYNAYTSPDIAIPSQFCEDGASNWTLAYSYPAGTFSSSGNITVTFITKKAGTITAWTAKRVSSITTINFNCATVPWVVNGNTYGYTVGLDEGGDAIRGGIAVGGNTSGSAYDAATVNTPVNITQAEYNAILSTVPSASLTGINSLASSGGYGNPFLNGIGGLVVGTPANNYIVATAFKTVTNTTAQFHLLSSSTFGTTASCFTNFAASQSYLGNTIYYFAIKRPSSHIGSNIYLGAGSTPAQLIQCTPSSGQMYYVNGGQTTSCPTPPSMPSLSSTVSGMIQFISTPVKSF